PGAAGGARPARRLGHGRLLRLGRHDDGQGRALPARRAETERGDPRLPDEAAAAFVRGIEERAPRMFAPKWWRYYSAFRGLINPLIDKRQERDAKTQALLRDIDARALGEQ